jgi:hypothetical protein
VKARFDKGGEGAEGKFSFDTDVTAINSILIHLCEENDKVRIDKEITIPATIWGGGGDDDLVGGGGDDLIFGEGGEDNIDGGEGNDILSGGDDNDKLNGGRDLDVLIGAHGKDNVDGGEGGEGGDLGDLLVGGWTVHDLDPVALGQIRDIWTSGDDYEDIVDQLTGSGGLLEPGQTAFDDGAKDKLRGSNKARDLFFADLDREGNDDDDVKGDKNDILIELDELLGST